MHFRGAILLSMLMLTACGSNGDRSATADTIAPNDAGAKAVADVDAAMAEAQPAAIASSIAPAQQP